ncbi:MAG: hypothetical protein AMXMBFR84_07780 [Candidatus Hydrogenedentota bacterium]
MNYVQAIQSIKAPGAEAAQSATAVSATSPPGSGGLFAVLLALLQGQAAQDGTIQLEGAAPPPETAEGDQPSGDASALIAGLITPVPVNPPVPLLEGDPSPSIDAVDTELSSQLARVTTQNPVVPAAEAELPVEDATADAPGVTLPVAVKPIVENAEALTVKADRHPPQTPPASAVQPVSVDDEVSFDGDPVDSQASESLSKDVSKEKPEKAAKIVDPNVQSHELEVAVSHRQPVTEFAPARVQGVDVTTTPTHHALKATQVGTDSEAGAGLGTIQSTIDALPENAVRSIRYLVDQNESSVRVRLVPESLGEVHVEVTSQREALVVRMSSPNAGVRDVLQNQVHLLRDALLQSGVDVSRITVTAEAAPQQGHNPNTPRPPLSQAYSNDYGGAPPRGGTASHSQSGGQNRRGAWYAGSLNMFA